MKTRDRVILTFLTIGIWGLIGTVWLKPDNVNAHDDGHTHYEYAEDGHSHGYAEEGHSHDYAEEGHSHTCYVDGDYADCM
jgi:hypothetical protein